MNSTDSTTALMALTGDNYANNTVGVPRTDFVEMEAVGIAFVRSTAYAEIEQKRASFDAIWADNRMPPNAAGKWAAEVWQRLDAQMVNLNFNAFAFKTDGNSLFQPESEMLCSLGTLIAVYTQRQAAQKGGREETPPPTGAEYVVHELCALARQKDGEYGASWCKRGGIGAWLTTVRKFDRLVNQLEMADFSLSVHDVAGSTESLDETLKDAINYLLLILQKRIAIHRTVCQDMADVYGRLGLYVKMVPMLEPIATK